MIYEGYTVHDEIRERHIRGYIRSIGRFSLRDNNRSTVVLLGLRVVPICRTGSSVSVTHYLYPKSRVVRPGVSNDELRLLGVYGDPSRN